MSGKRKRARGAGNTERQKQRANLTEQGTGSREKSAAGGTTPRAATHAPPPPPRIQPASQENTRPALETRKTAARSQFDDWAVWYDRTVLNELVFFPSIRACQEEIARWQLTRGGRPYRMLDVGCGTGSLLALMSRDEAAERLVGLDYSREMVRRAASKFLALRRATRLHAVNGDAERLPFPASAFDVLTCCNSFHHYPNPARAMQEFCRVLRPGGMLVLIDGFRDNLLGFVVFEVGVKLAERHIRHLTARDYRDGLQRAGFMSLAQRKLNVLAPLLVNVAGR